MGAPERYPELVEQVLSALLPDRCELAPKVASWVEAVATWNRQMDLTAARDDRELVDLMVADAALLAGVVAPSSGAVRQQVVDVGTGAGAPGLPLALLRPDLAVTLVEPKQKRAALLRMTLGRLGCQSPRAGDAAADGAATAQVLQTRGEALDESFDVALSRATLSPPAWLELGARLAPVGEVWVLLAREPAPARDGWCKVEERRYRWPLTEVERRAACYRPR